MRALVTVMELCDAGVRLCVCEGGGCVSWCKEA